MKKLWLIVGLAVVLSLASVGLADAQGSGHFHYVASGETLHIIAAKYGVSVEALMRQNGLTNPHMIYAGQPLIVPGRSYNSGAGSSHSCADYHTVKAGETLSGIAYTYGLAVQELVRYNSLYNQDFVYVGQKLCMPTLSKGYATQRASYQDNQRQPYYHTVAAGETLSKIAHRHGVDYLEIMRHNNIYNPAIVRVGEKLVIPGYQPAPAPKKGPAYSPPAAPPSAPHYDATYEDSHKPTKKPPPEQSYSNTPPPAPTYQEAPPLPLLPEADHPIEVVVNGGMSWVGEPFPAFPDPNGETILIVHTEEPTDATVWMQSGDYKVKGELGLVPEFGIDKFRFAFRYIPPGDYDVWLEDPDGTPSQRVQVDVDPGKRVEVGFRKGLAFSGPNFASPDGWVLASWDNPSRPGENIGGWSNILVKTPASGLWVKIESEGRGYEAKCFTGTKGPGACDFAGLMAGFYWIWIDGTDLTIKTYVDGNAYATFELFRQPTDSKADRDKIGPVNYD